MICIRVCNSVDADFVYVKSTHLSYFAQIVLRITQIPKQNLLTLRYVILAFWERLLHVNLFLPFFTLLGVTCTQQMSYTTYKNIIHVSHTTTPSVVTEIIHA